MAFREYTAAGHLRQPVFVRMRTDKRADECIGTFDEPAPAPRVNVDERRVDISHRDKMFFPELGLTKGDLVDYYDAIAPWMLPYLEDRPLVLTRFPDGIHGKSFYQRDAPEFVPEWIRRETLWSEGAEREVHYFIVDDAASLRYLINLGTIPIHTWHSRVGDLAHPDWCVLDLDPKDAPFASVIAVARAIRDLALELELPAYLKTSGASGPARADSAGQSADARSVAHLRAPARAHHRRSLSGDRDDRPQRAAPRTEGVHRLSAERSRPVAGRAVQRARRAERRRFDAAAVGAS